jgi:hypothetical protein
VLGSVAPPGFVPQSVKRQLRVLRDLYERSIKEDKGEDVLTSRPVRTIRTGPRVFGLSLRFVISAVMPWRSDNQFDLVSLHIAKDECIGEEVLAYYMGSSQRSQSHFEIIT